MSAALRERCHLTDLLVAECAHCRPAPPRPPALPAELAGLDFGDEPAGAGPVFTAAYYSTCGGCGSGIQPGDEVRMLDGEAVHEGCA